MISILTKSLIIILCLTSLSFADEVPLTADFLYPDIPAAAANGSEAVILNPAALYINKPASLQYFHSFAQGSLSGDNAFLISTGGIGFAYQRLALNQAAEISRYDFAFSSRVLKNLYTALSYTYYKTDYKALDKVHAWNYSLLYHLSRELSIAAQLLNFNRHRFSDQRSAMGFSLSSALKLIGGKLVIGGDFKMYDGQQLKDSRWRISTRAKLKEGLTVYSGFGGQGGNNNFGIGIEIGFGTSHIGGESFFNSDGYQQSTTYGGVSAINRGEFLKKKKILRVNLNGKIPERREEGFFLSKTTETVYQKLSKIKLAKDDPSIAGILLYISAPNLGWGQLTDFRNCLLQFKESGKPVYCYLGSFPGNGSYYLASVADSIFMLPVDVLYLTGLRAEVQFLKGLLDKLDIKAEIVKEGKYKNAPNRFTEDSLTPEHREAVETLLDDLYRQILSEISTSRGISLSEMEKLINQGPFTSLQAESLKLIDDRFYPGQISEQLNNIFGNSFVQIGTSQYQSIPEYQEKFGEPDYIAIISIEGSIVRGRSGKGYFSGEKAGSATITGAIRVATNNPAIKAIVLRLNTPGGDAIASDLIWGELIEAGKKKPIVVSMSSVCASGGYYIATAADQIFLQPTTVTGSIGVYHGKINLEGFYNKIGISSETIKRGDHANMFSRSQAFSADEKEIINRQVQDMYNHFVKLTADNRKLTIDSVHAISQGRVWSGKRALQLGLADKEGSILDAITAAAKLANLEQEDFQVVEISYKKKWLNFPATLLSAVAQMTLLNLTSDNFLLELDTELLLDDNLQMRIPYKIEIK